ncbi:hypothetical protein [Clostridium hydrogenum]|uniref:hypothetical protein n=1 Tax=Clostridium hydrogenum TaxID=2855764 RepID=UPI002E306496|nr:hypothetical protein [Clostridium hydrogenum]
MTDNKGDCKKSTCAFNKLVESIDNLLTLEKEQKLKIKLAKEIKNSIFTSEIITELNENDFSGVSDEEENRMEVLFSSIFPVFIKKGDVIFRLYKHKIEVDLSYEMRDRYIYIFSDGRLTSGLFQCFSLSDDEYVYGVKQIIDAIPSFKNAIIDTLENYKSNIDIHNDRIQKSKSREQFSDKNYKELLDYLLKSREH